MKLCIVTLIIFMHLQAYSQSAELTPVQELNTHTVPVTVPEKFSGMFPEGKTLKVPSNYKVSVFHAGGLNKPRFMTFDSKGVLHISDMTAGKVFALPDLNQDGVSDTLIEAITGLSGNHDVVFYKGVMYVTESTRIWKCTDTDNDGVYETKTVFISNIGNNQTGGHTTRTVVFDSIEQKVYVSVGSSCNVCRESARAIIEVYDMDGTNRRVMATGVRNAVGMALHPVTNRLWANNNGSDQQGNEIPPEWIDLVRDSGFYGHPFVYGSGVWFNFQMNAAYQALLPITATDSANVARLVPPAALVRAHSAPMAITFLNESFGTEKRNGFLIALRGSWNTTNPRDYRGYKVIYGHLSSAQDTTVDYVSDFCSGFITDTVNRVYWGRPVGLAINKQGNVYISSDEGNKCILVMTPDPNTSVTKEPVGLSDLMVYPNPAQRELTITYSLKQPQSVEYLIRDLTGKEVKHIGPQAISAGKHNELIPLDGLTPGVYFISIKSGQQMQLQKIVVMPVND